MGSTKSCPGLWVALHVFFGVPMHHGSLMLGLAESILRCEWLYVGRGNGILILIMTWLKAKQWA